MAIRDIIFRGKRIDNGEWVEGYFYQHPLTKDCFILVHDFHNSAIAAFGNLGCPVFYKVDPSTVGQYTGLTDKNGKRIFEGDIIKSWQGKILAVKFGQYRDDEEVVSGNGWYVTGEYGTLSFDERWGGHEVIGTIHDNPELVKEEPT